jgi:hypothetical protein
VQCCTHCSHLEDSHEKSTCHNPSNPIDGLCPLRENGEDCLYSSQCKEQCIAGVCGKTVGDPCGSDNECHGEGTTLVCEGGYCKFAADQTCDSAYYNHCVEGTTCVADGDRRYCRHGPGDSCANGEKCVGGSGLMAKCFGGRCAYPFKEDCISFDGDICERPSGLAPEATVVCTWKPQDEIRQGAVNHRCLPELPKDAPCASELDCIKGPCEAGVCTSGVKDTPDPNDAALDFDAQILSWGSFEG